MLPSPQHRIAPLAAMDRHDDGAMLDGIESRDELVDLGPSDQRHVSKTDDGAISRFRNGSETGSQRGRKAVCVVWILDESNSEIGETGTNLLALMTRHHDNRPRHRREHGFDAPADHRLVPHIDPQPVPAPTP